MDQPTSKGSNCGNTISELSKKRKIVSPDSKEATEREQRMSESNEGEIPDVPPSSDPPQDGPSSRGSEQQQSSEQTTEGQALEERLKRKMEEFEKQKSQETEPTLEERYQRKLDEHKKTKKKKSRRESSRISKRKKTPTPPAQDQTETIEDRYQRKLDEHNKAVKPSGGTASESMEDRLEKKMAVLAPKPEPTAASSMEERLKRKMAEMDTKRKPPPPAAMRSSSSMEDRLNRKMSAYRESGRASSSGELLDERLKRKVNDFNDSKKKITVVPDPGQEERMSGKMSLDDPRLMDDEAIQKRALGEAMAGERGREIGRGLDDGPEDYAAGVAYLETGGSQRSNGALEPTTSISKDRGADTVAGQQPGAYSVDQRAIGARPAWGRVVRNMGRSIRQTMTRSFRSQSNLGADDSNVPPELRGISDVPPELQGASDFDPELFGQPEEPRFEFVDDTAPSEWVLPEDRKSRRSSLYVGVAVLVIVLSVSIGVGVAVSGGGGEEDEPVAAVSSSVPSASPTICEFDGLGFSGAVLSCQCFGTVVVTQEVTQKYMELKTTLASALGPDFTSTPDSCDRQNTALYWLAEDVIAEPANNQSLHTRYGLVNFFLAFSNRGTTANLDLARWKDRSGWLSTQSECDWFGVYCSNGLVTAIRFTRNGLEGTIPSELSTISSLGQCLTDLEVDQCFFSHHCLACAQRN